MAALSDCIGISIGAIGHVDIASGINVPTNKVFWIISRKFVVKMYTCTVCS